MNTDEVRALLQKLESLSLDMDAETLGQVHKACGIIETMSAQQCREVVKLAGSRPCLICFMSDGWALDLRTTVINKADGVQVRNPFRLRSEFAMQRSIVKTRVGSDIVLAIKVERPRLLSTKKCIDLWSASTDFCPLLKLQGHTGISVSVYLQDGLFAKPFAKRMQARHSLFFDRQHCPMGSWTNQERELADLKDWCFSFTCCAHACSRGLKWGLKSLVIGGDQMLEDTHVSISALLRASTGLAQVVPEFIAGYVDFVRPVPDSFDELNLFWSFFDIEPRNLDLVIKVNPMWTGQRLQVSAGLISDPNWRQCVTTVINMCIRQCDFSDTRWVKVGRCGRNYVRSLIVGIDKLVELAMRSDAICKYHLGGYQRKCSSTVRTYLTVAACASRPSETLLLELLHDDRFLLHSQRYWQVMVDELSYLTVLSPDFWSTLASLLTGGDAISLKHSVLDCSLISMAYIHLECWIPLTNAPWKYLVGDVKKNITALKEEANVQDVVSCKIQTLCLLGYEAEVVAACLLARESSFTTTLVEQAHASGAMIARRHPQLEHAQLVSRMTVHNCRALFAPGKYEKQLLHLQYLIDQVDYQMKNAIRTSARNQYVKMLIQQVKATRGVDGPSDFALRRSVFKHHMKTFKVLGPGQLGVLRVKAAAHVKAKVDDLSESKQHLLHQLSLLQTRQAELKNIGLPNHIESVSFGGPEMARFAELWAHTNTRARDVTVLPPPGKVPAAVETLLQDTIVAQHVQKPALSPWMSSLLSLRDIFAGCAFYCDVTNPDCDVIYYLLVAICQPRRAVFAKLNRARPAARPSLYDLPSGVAPEVLAYKAFDMDNLRLVDHTGVPWTSLSDIWVLPDCRWQGMSLTVAAEPTPWSVFVRYAKPTVLPKKPQSEQRSRVPVAEDILLLLQQEFPWLTLAQLREMLQTKTSVAVGGGGQAQPSNPGASGSSTVPVRAELTEDVVARVHTELADLRAQVLETNLPDSHFKLRVLGGEWSEALFGKTATDVGCYARDRTVETWCTVVAWPPRKSFAVTKHEGFQNCRMLSEEMRRKGDFYMDAWLAAGSPSPFSFAECAQHYQTVPEYRAWMDSLPLNSEQAKAALEIVGLTPRPVPV